MTPTAINIASGSPEPLKITFDDETGVTLTSHKKLSINAGQDISLYTPKKIVIKAPNLIVAKKLSKLSGFTIESEYHFLGDQINKNGSDRTSYPKYDDEPATWTPPQPEPKPKFKWGKLFKNVLAGLAVVAAVTAVAVLCVATLGAGAVVIGAVAAGAAISGTAAVASMAVSDVMRGEVSDMGDYMMSAFRESTIGAISGAVFGPFGTMATIGGKMGMGAATNAFESVIRQGMEGNGFSFKTLVMDAGIGAVTAGVLDSRIAKATGRAIKQGTKAVGNTIAQGVKATGGAIKQGAKAIGEGSKQAAAWISNGAKKAEKQFNEQLKRLAEAGSNLASRFERPMAFADGPGGSFSLSKVEPTPEPKLNDRQLNYRQAMAEAEARAGAGGKPSGGSGKTEQDYRKLIDEAEARGDSKAANDLRYERYCARKEASGDVPRSREDWDIANERLKNNSGRGSEEEKQGRESLAKHLGRELEDNNTDKVVTFTSSEGHVTRPDSIGRNENKEIDIVHDHKHLTGEGNQVIYNDSQMRAEKEMAERVENGRHIVTMSSDNPDLYGVPPKPRPSAPLSSGSEIYYTDPSTGKVTHKWVIDRETGEGFWEDL